MQVRRSANPEIWEADRGLAAAQYVDGERGRNVIRVIELLSIV